MRSNFYRVGTNIKLTNYEIIKVTEASVCIGSGKDSDEA